MPKCSYCGKDYDLGKGLTFILTSGEVIYLCSSKCRKNWKMGRDKKKVKWIKKTKKEKEVYKYIYF